MRPNENFTAHWKKPDEVRSKEWRSCCPHHQDVWSGSSLLGSSLAPPHSGRCFHMSLSHSSSSLCGKDSGCGGGAEADSGASGRLTEVMGWAEGRPWGRPSVRPPCPPSLPLAHPCCSAPHPDTSIPMAVSPSLRSPIKIARPIILPPPLGPQGLQHHYQD